MVLNLDRGVNMARIAFLRLRIAERPEVTRSRKFAGEAARAVFKGPRERHRNRSGYQARLFSLP